MQSRTPSTLDSRPPKLPSQSFSARARSHEAGIAPLPHKWEFPKIRGTFKGIL